MRRWGAWLATGMILAALLISYLPTMYSAFSSRETLVNLLETRAGSPPSRTVELLGPRVDAAATISYARIRLW